MRLIGQAEGAARRSKTARERLGGHSITIITINKPYNRTSGSKIVKDDKSYNNEI
jgi:hypothetical protein